MLKYSIAAVALAACSSFAIADQMDRGDKEAGSPNSAAEHAPGQLKGGGSAKVLAPGQRKEEGSSAKEYAPGQSKDNSASRPDDKSGSQRKSENMDGSKAKDTDRNAKNSESDRNDRTRSEESRSESGKDHSSTGASEGTEGRSDSKGSITSVSEEQKARVKSVFSRHHVDPARNLNVSVNVGVALPRSIHLYPIPEDIVLIVPEYRGYEYIMLDDDRVAIIDPDTFEVVDIIVIT